MAGGKGSRKQHGNLDKIYQWLYRHQLYASLTILELPPSEKFKEHQIVHKYNINVESISRLHNNILRNYNIYALPRCNTKEHLQKVKKYAEVNTNLTLSDMADSGSETSCVSPQENTSSENSNTDFEESQAAEYISANEELDKRNVKQTHADHTTLIDTKCYDTSYNNSEIGCHMKDLVKSTILKCTSNDHTNVTCSSLHIEHQHVNPSTSSTENDQNVRLHADEIFQYENQVLSEPFYESDCGSNENESFEFIDLGNASSMSGVIDKESAKYEIIGKLQEEILYNNHLEVKDVETAKNSEYKLPHSSDLNKQKNSSGTTSYYFIDASTLNDEIEILTSTSQSKCSDIKAQLHAFHPTECTSSNLLEDQSCKSAALKMSNLQVDYDKMTENKLKCTEYLQSVTESCNIKGIVSMSAKKINTDKGTEKEFLNVEIKEVDSGESAYPSPSVDNNINLNNDKQEVISLANNEQANGKVVKDTGGKNRKIKESEEKVNSAENTDRPVLIRRNTFELDSNDEKLSILRQEYERRQGNLVFQNSIPQYSGHRVDGDSFYDLSTEIAVPPLNDVNKFTLAQIPTTTSYVTSYVPSDKHKCKIHQTQTQSENNYLLPNNIEKSNITYPVTKSASDRILMNCCTNLSNVSNNCSNSLPVTLNCVLDKGNQMDLTKKTKRDETTPIISGGVSTSDYSKPTDSPSVRRKTESTPIVSGGSVIMNEPEMRIKSSRMSSSMTAWIVDMSDCTKTSESKSSTTNNSYINMSQSFSVSECTKRPIRKSNGNHQKHSSLGFFVNLKDMDTKQSPKSDCAIGKKESNEDSRPYYEFYVDMSDNNHTTKYKKSEIEDVSNKVENIAEVKDKKNMFSMFIDLGNLQETNKDESKIIHRRSFPTFSDKQTENVHSNGSSSTAQDQSLKEQISVKEKSKPSGFMFIGLDSPVMRRRTLSSSRPTFKRHSWNVDKTQTNTITNNNNNTTNNKHIGKELPFKKEHKRAHSLSVDRGDLKKLQAVAAKPSSSNHSLNDASRADSLIVKNSKCIQEKECNSNNMDTSSEDVFEFDVKDTPPNSHIEVINEEGHINIKHHEYKEFITNGITKNVETVDVKGYEDEYSETSAWEKTCTESTEGQTRKSETFDISSDSGPSPSSDNHDYELSDLLNGKVSNITDKSKVIPVGNKISETQKSLTETIKKIECELKSPEYEKLDSVYNTHNITAKTDQNVSSYDLKELYLDPEKTISPNFVRLSDLDKTPAASHTSDILIMKEDRATYRMSNSIPETSWIESKLAMSRTNASIRQIPKKYTTIMSTSLPPKQKSPLEELTGECEAEGIISESDLSSMQSSMGRSGAGSTEETETSSLAGGKPYNRLGEDLLRMFLEEINPDITIDVAGRRIRAHKCILSSRCQYFAAILSGGWIESAGNVISLQGYSYNAVHFALCHIYSGESNIPESISIVELATLADMLCLEGLKEVIGYTLKVKYCHLFHKPCQICAVGVLECMPLAAAYGLDEVYRKSLRWITRHFVRIWPCKAFATLPKELMEKCYHQHIVHMSTDNVLQTMMDCDKLLATLPNVRWAEPVFKMVSNLLETSVKFLSDNFAGVLGNENFQSLGLELTWNISRLEDHFLAAAEHLPPEQACKSYTKLHKMLITIQTDDSQGKIKWGSLFIDFLKKIQSRVEKCLVRDAARASRTTMWLKMDLELRRRIQELACLVILPHEACKRQSRHSNFLKEPKVLSNHSTSRTLDLKRVKMVISEHNDKTLKQVTTQNKKVLNKPKSDPLERKMQEDKQNIFDTSVRPKSWPNKIEVKSRYLEPRNKSISKETTQQTYPEKVIVQQRRKIMISSSDSSRTSSPAMKRATEKKSLVKVKLPIKKDVKALSSDSLTEPNVSKTNRKSIISKSCGITRPESPSFKQKVTEIGLSVDSLAESKNKSVPVKKKIIKMDTSMSTDSLMTEMVATPKSSTSNKLSPTLNKGANKQQICDRTKKNSPPILQRNPLTMTRRPQRSLENSTAASRSRAAAINTYHGSPSLRRNLLDAAKTPDIPSKSLNNMSYKTLTTRQVAQSTTVFSNVRREKKENSSNQQNSESPSKRSSPKSSSTNKSSRSVIVNKRTMCRGIEDKGKLKCHNGEVPKLPSVGSRSGTFLKDEPTILKKVDIKSSQINT